MRLHIGQKRCLLMRSSAVRQIRVNPQRFLATVLAPPCDNRHPTHCRRSRMRAFNRRRRRCTVSNGTSRRAAISFNVAARVAAAGRRGQDRTCNMPPACPPNPRRCAKPAFPRTRDRVQDNGDRNRIAIVSTPTTGLARNVDGVLFPQQTPQFPSHPITDALIQGVDFLMRPNDTLLTTVTKPICPALLNRRANEQPQELVQ